MSDERLRKLERRAAESGSPDDSAQWILMSYRMGRPSLARCLECQDHGCACDKCKTDKTCERCGGSGFMGMDDAVVLGSVFEDPGCVIASGWRPKDVKVRDTNFVEADWTTGGMFNPVTKTRRPNTSERLRLYTKMGAVRIQERAHLALMEGTAEALGATVAGEVSRQGAALWRAMVLEPCKVKREERRSEYRAHRAGLAALESTRILRRGHWTYANGPERFRYSLKSEDDAARLINAALVPYLLGHRDHWAETLETTQDREVNSTSDHKTQESRTAPL